MQKAEQNLQKKNQQNQEMAEKDEKEALKELDKAKEKLKQQKEELQNQMQEEILFQLETALKEALEKELEIRETTLAKEQKRITTGSLSREDNIELKNLGNLQSELRESVERVQKKLEEENASVFAWIVQDVADSMQIIANSLKLYKTGHATLSLEDEVIEQLEELIEAMKQERKKKKSQGGRRWWWTAAARAAAG